MENTIDDSIDSTVNINVGVIPSSNELRNNPLEDLGGNLTSWFIENLGMVSK